jgi:hypothetical protein
MKTVKLMRMTVLVLAVTFVASMASAQALNSGAQTIALNANLQEYSRSIFRRTR